MHRVAFVLLGVAAAVRAGRLAGVAGADRQGIVREERLPLTWGGKDRQRPLEGPAPRRRTLAARTRTSPARSSAGDRVFVTALVLAGRAIPQKEFPEHHVVCFRAADGKRLWDTTVPPGPWLLKDLRGGYTAPTPACDGERVYVLFGSSVLAALDLDGKLVWRKEIAPHCFDVAIGTSPVLYTDTVLLMCDQTEARRPRGCWPSTARPAS